MVYRSYQIGDHTFGIRTTSEAFGSWLDRTLRQYAVDEETDSSYSIVVAGGEDRPGKGIHILYVGAGQIVRTLDLPTVGRVLLAELDRLGAPTRDDAIFLNASIVALDGVNALIPAHYALTLVGLGRRLEREGLRLPVDRTAAVDLRTGRAVSPQPLIEVPEDAFDELEALAGGNGHADRATLPSETPVDAVCVGGEWRDEETSWKVSRGQALADLGAHTINIQELGRSAMEGLIPLVQGAECYGIRSGVGRDLLKNLTSLLKS